MTDPGGVPVPHPSPYFAGKVFERGEFDMDLQPRTALHSGALMWLRAAAFVLQDQRSARARVVAPSGGEVFRSIRLKEPDAVQEDS